MNLSRKTIFYIFVASLLMPLRISSQNIAQKDSINSNLLNAAREIMAAAGTCALISLDENDSPMVRTMDPFLPESDFTVWFGTNAKSRKVSQIKKNPKVTLYYLDKDASGYVVIHGKAQLVNDEKEKEKRWKAEWEAFYPDKTESYLLIKVTPEWMEVLSYTRGIVSDPINWQPPLVVFDSKK